MKLRLRFEVSVFTRPQLAVWCEGFLLLLALPLSLPFIQSDKIIRGQLRIRQFRVYFLPFFVVAFVSFFLSIRVYVWLVFRASFRVE